MKLSRQDNLKLNLGSGRKRYPSFINIDRAKLPETDLVWDLEEVPLPFKDNSVSEIVSEHVLEHISNLPRLLEEMYRITKPNGRWKIVVPYYKYEGTFRDPTHRCFFSENTFDYFTEGNTFDYYSNVRLKVLKKELRNSSKTKLKTPIKRIRKFVPFKKFLNIFLWNLYSEIYFELEVVKDKVPEKSITREWRGLKR